MTIRHDDPTMRPPFLAGEGLTFPPIIGPEEDPADRDDDGIFYLGPGPEPEAVQHPNHYQSETGLECFDAQVAALGVGGAVQYAKGCIMKYVWRGGKKGEEAQDLRKAAQYALWAADLLDNGPRKF